MKNILVLTDFSANANQALNYAIAIANQIESNIHLLHGYVVSSQAGHLSDVGQHIKEDRERELNKLIEAHAPCMLGGHLKGRIRNDYIERIVNSEYDHAQSDLVVIGRVGETPLVDRVLGSNTIKLIKASKYPTLIIPEHSSIQKIKRIMLAVDANSCKELSVFEPLIRLAQKFFAELVLLHVSSMDYHTEMDPNLENYFKSKGLTVHQIKTKSEDVLEEISAEIEQQDIHMLTVLSRQRSWFKSIFHSSISQQLAKKADIPVLVLQDGPS